MRIWTLDPRYLDARGLVALWREALLAKAVLRGETRGYRAHPQLERFRATADPVRAINAYLGAVLDESRERGYHFDATKVSGVRGQRPISVTRGQMRHEWEHLMRKLHARDRAKWTLQRDVVRPRVHPLFKIVAGPIAPWERSSTTG
jgi:hypothetical protein